MKKITFMLFASATIFLASCGNGAEKTETTTTDSTVVCCDSTKSTVDSTATKATVDTTKTVK
jgi:ABC-type oligopeptide transport system substrate-binding subunit